MTTTIKIETIAKACHEINRQYCIALGDNSQPSWEDAPEWQKQSAINGVEFHFNNPKSSPADSHNNWMADKVSDGWVYGKNKNPKLKTHPCMMPYHQLPREQRAKDKFFMLTVKSLSI